MPGSCGSGTQRRGCGEEGLAGLEQKGRNTPSVMSMERWPPGYPEALDTSGG